MAKHLPTPEEAAIVLLHTESPHYPGLHVPWALNHDYHSSTHTLELDCMAVYTCCVSDVWAITIPMCLCSRNQVSCHTELGNTLIWAFVLLSTAALMFSLPGGFQYMCFQPMTDVVLCLSSNTTSVTSLDITTCPDSQMYSWNPTHWLHFNSLP